jgi:alpha-ribazole phosphatase
MVATGTGVIDLLRHGETEGGSCFRGRCDDALSAAGWRQLQQATAVEVGGAAPAWERVLCSPATRCAAFAAWLSDRLGLLLEKDDALWERDFGAWEGLSSDRIPVHELAAFWADPLSFDPPGAEPFGHFRDRVVAGWRRLAGAADEHAKTLIVTHGGVIRVILGEILGLDASRLILLEVPHACRSRIRVPVGDGRPSLVGHGDPAGEGRA